MKSGLATTALAVLSVASAAAAQATPWSKDGLQRLNAWSPASTLTIGDAEHGASGIALRFRGDASAGVVLESIAHRGTRPDGVVTWVEYRAEPPTGEAKGLWKAVLRPESSDTPFDLGPDAAAAFSVWVDQEVGTRVAVFAWDGLQLPAAADSRFWFELRVSVDAAEPARATWLSRMGRITQPGTVRWSMDEVHAPIVYVRHVGALPQSRILLPAALNSPVPATNLSLAAWAAAGYRLVFDNPARHQQMQFSALYCADPTAVPLGDRVLSGHRKALYFSTEDAEGWFKRFHHGVFADGTGVYYRWAPAYFPRHPPSPWKNTFSAPYPAVTRALQAETDAWWYDVAAEYREFVRREMRLTRIDDPNYELNRDFVGASLFMPCSTVGFVHPDPDAIFATYTDEALRRRQFFRDPAGNPAKVFMEWQKWLEGTATDSPYPGIGAEDPIGPGFNPLPSDEGPGYQHPTVAAKAQVARAWAGGVNVSTYLLPPLVQSDHWTSFREEWFLRRRDGSPHPVGILPGRLADFGVPQVSNWFRNVMFDDVMRTIPQLGGLYLDTLGGTGSFLRYEPAETHRNFRLLYHGGKEFVQGVARTIEGARQRVKQGKGTAVHPNVPFVLTEAVQEGLTGTYDFAQHGYKPLPRQMDLNPLFDLAFGAPPVPDSSNPTPPLWNLVYHEWSRAEAVGVPLNAVGVQAALGGGQPTLGLTWAQWADYQRLMHALPFVQGMNPFVESYFYGLEPYNLLVDEPGGGIEVRDRLNPSQTQLVDFLRVMFHALWRNGEAGQFLRGGVEQRPLQMPAAYSPLAVSQSLSPSFFVGQLTDPNLLGSRAFYEDPFTLLPYQTAHVLHSVWRTREDATELGLVFVNWSDQPGTWEGVLDPARYGLPNDFVIEGIAPDGAGVTRFEVGEGSGPTVLAWSAAHPGLRLRHHSQGSAGTMPPRSVQVFVVH